MSEPQRTIELPDVTPDELEALIGACYSVPIRGFGQIDPNNPTFTVLEKLERTKLEDAKRELNQ